MRNFQQRNIGEIICLQEKRSQSSRSGKIAKNKQKKYLRHRLTNAVQLESEIFLLQLKRVRVRATSGTMDKLKTKDESSDEVPCEKKSQFISSSNSGQNKKIFSSSVTFSMQ
jgi:hypothetical protein